MTDARTIPDRLRSPASTLLKSWETLLLAVAVAVFVVNSLASPYFLSAWNLSDATFNFTEKAMIAFPMALLIIAGERDSVVPAVFSRRLYEAAPQPKTFLSISGADHNDDELLDGPVMIDAIAKFLAANE